MTHHPWRRFATLIAALFVLQVALDKPSTAGWRGSASRLQAKLQETVKQRKKLQSALRELKASQDRYRNRLVAAQEGLDEAQGRIQRTRRQLARTRTQIEGARERLVRAQARLEAHSEAMSGRLLAAYRAEQPGYMEVLLTSDTLSDLVNRAEFTKRMVDADAGLLAKIVEQKQEIERERATLERKEAEQSRLIRQLEADKRTAAVYAEEAMQRLKAANAERAEAERQLAQMEAESSAIAARLARLQRGEGSGARYSGSWSGSLLRPVLGGRFSSGFGWRIHPITRTRRFHDGVDIACASGTTIRAAADGVVVHAGWQGVYGKTVLIDHGSGMATMYAHCSQINVSYGQKVSRGQAIAQVGSTGWSTGPHLHFGLRRYGEPVDPMRF